MVRPLKVLLAILCVSTYLEAGTAAIGTVVSQGDLRIDDYPVKMSGTIFEGSDIETGASAFSTTDVRLGSSTKITLHADSRGKLYHDRLVLLRGKVDLASLPSFRTEVSGLLITSSDQHSSGVISIGPGGAVNVLASTGNFRVVKASGSFLAQVSPKSPLTFSRAEGGRWQIDNLAPEDFRDNRRCYFGGDDEKDARDCGGYHHHHHPSK